MPHCLIPVNGITVVGDLEVPGHSTALIVFVHGSGSSRLSPRNQQVARTLREAGFATLLFDLLTPDEAERQELVFDINLLLQRMWSVMSWVRTQPLVAEMPVGLFGASTGAAAALLAAAEPKLGVGAVVSRGGRPDLVLPSLPKVTAPTLLVVGEEDETVLDLNRRAAKFLTCTHEIRVISGAGHLFEEPGAMEQVAQAATHWFEAHLGSA